MRRNRSAEMLRKGATAPGFGTHITFHALRHHYASLLIGAGWVKAVQEALGHATAAETLDTYSHLWPVDEDRTREAVDSAHRRVVRTPAEPPGAQ